MKRFAVFYFLLSTFAFGAVVLPERFAGQRIIIKNSAEYKSLAKENRELSKQLESERADRGRFETDVDLERQARELELSALRTENAKFKAASHKSWLGGIWSVVSLSLSFISNPFGFIVSKLISIGLGILAIGLFVVLVRAGIRRLRNRRH